MIALTPKSIVLAIDASTQTTSLALFQASHCLGQEAWQNRRGNSGTLVSAIATMRHAANIEWTQIEAILIGCGPGQYAGLRASVAAAQAIQLPAKGKVIGIASAYAMLAAAHAANPDAPALVVCGDARRNHIWTYSWLAGAPQSYSSMQCLPLPACSKLQYPSGSLILSPDYDRLCERLDLPHNMNWIPDNQSPDPTYMLQIAYAQPALLGPPDIHYVHPPVAG